VTAAPASKSAPRKVIADSPFRRSEVPVLTGAGTSSFRCCPQQVKTDRTKGHSYCGTGSYRHTMVKRSKGNESKHSLPVGKTVAGAKREWKIGAPIAENIGHVKHVTEAGGGGRGQASRAAVIKGPQYKTAKGLSRFTDEVSGMRELADRGIAGVLPIVDWPSNVDERWYVMPTATPLATKLTDVDFNDVVSAVATLADTLDVLSQASGQSTGSFRTVAHRDIKPENLFWHGEGPVLADFGIAAWFDNHPTPTVSEEGERLGPVNYLAPEARYYYEGIDWHSADIYSLAMTFWSLAERRRISRAGDSTVALPPPGPIVASHRSLSMARFGGPDASALDVLMEQATSLDPHDRPTAAEFRDELLAWMDTYPGPHPRPKHLFITGFGPLRRIIARMELDQSEFLDVLRVESRKVLKSVEFDDTVTTDYKPRGESDRDGLPRSNAIMDPANHQRSEDDEWDGSFVVAFRSTDECVRLVIGGTFDTPGRVDWIAESHAKKNGSWQLVDSTEDRDLLIGRLTTRKIIREFLREHQPPIDAELSWVAERVL
jgi:serine/threonine protein kinase